MPMADIIAEILGTDDEAEDTKKQNFLCMTDLYQIGHNFGLWHMVQSDVGYF